MQWQYSPDDYSWYDIPNATQDHFSIVVDEENNLVYWRILVYIER